MFQLQTGQYLCVFISHEKYISVINTQLEISIMSTPTNSFHQSENIFTNDEHTILRGLSFIFALFDQFEKLLNHECKMLNHQFLCSSSPYVQN